MLEWTLVRCSFWVFGSKTFPSFPHVRFLLAQSLSAGPSCYVADPRQVIVC